MKPWTRFVSLVFQFIRLVLCVLMVPFLLLSILLAGCGQCGEWLQDVIENISRSMSVALKPAAWREVAELHHKNQQLEQNAAYWKSYAESLEVEKSEALQQI